jgi:acyl dehydratase
MSMNFILVGTVDAIAVPRLSSVAANMTSTRRRASRRDKAMNDDLYFDDLAPGMRFAAGPFTVTEADIFRFAAEFDPQPYHLDPVAAQDSALHGLAASGWHTAAITMRLIVAARPFGRHPILGLGVDELRWLAPVRPGDELSLEGEILELTPSRTKPHGVVRTRYVLRNQRGEAVYSIVPINIVPRRQ